MTKSAYVYYDPNDVKEQKLEQITTTNLFEHEICIFTQQFKGKLCINCGKHSHEIKDCDAPSTINPANQKKIFRKFFLKKERMKLVHNKELANTYNHILNLNDDSVQNRNNHQANKGQNNTKYRDYAASTLSRKNNQHNAQRVNSKYNDQTDNNDHYSRNYIELKEKLNKLDIMFNSLTVQFENLKNSYEEIKHDNKAKEKLIIDLETKITKLEHKHTTSNEMINILDNKVNILKTNIDQFSNNCLLNHSSNNTETHKAPYEYLAYNDYSDSLPPKNFIVLPASEEKAFNTHYSDDHRTESGTINELVEPEPETDITPSTSIVNPPQQKEGFFSLFSI
jgi:hypothetical protein